MALDISALPILSYRELCQRLHINHELHEWRSLVGLDSNVFDHLIQAAFASYAESIQMAPASESHHHCGPGGLLIHTHEVITLALKMRTGMKLPIGASISEIDAKQHLWTYGVFAACLLHDAGKLLTSTRILLTLKNGNQRWWTPHDKPLTEFGDAVTYSIQFVKTPYQMHTYIGPTLFDILPRMARAWLANETELMKQICAHLRGDRFESGVIGELAERADMESTRLNLQLPMPTQRFSKTLPLIDRYIGFIREWIADGSIRMNANGGMGWCDQDGFVYFVCRSLAEKIIRKCDEMRINDTPREVVRIYDILQEHGYALPTVDGKAIWTITAVGEDYRHAFTCLKFEARRLTVPTRPIKPFAGDILLGNIPAPESPVAPETDTKNALPTEEQDHQAAQSAAEAVGTHNSEDAVKETNLAEKNNAASSREEAVGTESERNETEKDSHETVSESETSDHVLESENEPDNKISETESAPAAPKPSLVFGAANKRREPVNEAVKKAEGKDALDTVSTQEAVIKTVEAAADHDQSAQQITQPDEEQLVLPIELEVSDTIAAIPSAQIAGTSEVLTAIVASSNDKPKDGDEQVSDSVGRSPGGLAVFQGVDSSDPHIADKILSWLRKNLIEKTIVVNDRTAAIHIVPEGVFILAPAIFKEFCVKHGLPESDHRKLSKKFDRKNYHVKSADGLNIHSYWAVGKSRHSKIAGRIIPFSLIYGDEYPMPKPNKYIHKTINDGQ